MPDVVGIRFKACGKIYDFEVNGLEVAKGDTVIVESELGLSIGSVIIGRRSLDNVTKELKKVLRKATDGDFKQKSENESLEKEARAYCLERIMARGLPMKLVSTEITLDKKRILFYFTADGRIDFRELVKDLAAKFRTRIEMRQIGVRDEAKIVGGFGICGRELCCKTFLTSFEPISIKMAKSQELALNANKLSGVCGRLMCCLGYEYSDTASAPCRDNQNTSLAEAEKEEELVDIIEEPQPEPGIPAEMSPVQEAALADMTADRKTGDDSTPKAVDLQSAPAPEGTTPAPNKDRKHLKKFQRHKKKNKKRFHR